LGFYKQSAPKLRAVLVYYVEKGDLRRAQKISGLSLEEFRELMKKANIPLM
jgi:predicted HTH domain antitoxin